ncbi:hypothetical protein E2C01_070568 [Portunus trituberculatus]|uniref:Uncharacterized protein n=1 Tax=Portunus trituberculatus TaxID=210409 RepID=A0A5B7HXM8_PORTR|nr:hypothetical protein [Portunus trituberculatus]
MRYNVVIILRSYSQSDKISILLTGETLLKTPLLISIVLENSRDEKAKRF